MNDHSVPIGMAHWPRPVSVNTNWSRPASGTPVRQVHVSPTSHAPPTCVTVTTMSRPSISYVPTSAGDESMDPWVSTANVWSGPNRIIRLGWVACCQMPRMLSAVGGLPFTGTLGVATGTLGDAGSVGPVASDGGSAPPPQAAGTTSISATRIRATPPVLAKPPAPHHTRNDDVRAPGRTRTCASGSGGRRSIR